MRPPGEGEATLTEPDLILFVCVHNAGRSQMAEALFNRHAAELGLADRFRAVSAGTVPADRVNPQVVAVMREVSLDLAGRRPSLLSPVLAARARFIVTMGCGGAESCPGGFLRVDEDWGLPDPHGRPLDEVRAIRDEVARRVLDLFERLAAETAGEGHRPDATPPFQARR